MSDFPTTLEQQFNQLFKNVEGWNVNALKRIGRRIKEIGYLSHADLQALNNATIVKQDIKAIIDDLATLTEQSAPEVLRAYSEALKNQHLENKSLYDYRNKPFIPFAENKSLQAIVKAYARTTLGTMVNLSMTKARAIGTVDKLGKFVPLERSFKDVLDKAVMAVSTGTSDFNSEMRDAIRQLGGSGMRIDYGGGVTRRVDSMVRQNLLWGAKQASVEYNEMIGEELDCDGIEIDWHSNPRPSHEFMQGKQYSLYGKKTIKGVVYEDAADALSALQDYGCLHYKTPIILGVSEPRYSPNELARLNAENKKPITIDGVTKTGYEWKQTMRALERESRITKEQMEIFNASGDKAEVSRLRTTLKAIDERYYKVAEGSGIKAQPGRMAYTKGVSKVVDNSAKSGIINISSPIRNRNSYKGRPPAVYTLDVDLNGRQQNLLQSLPTYNSRLIVRKKDVGMADLSALTAKTGVEFALFTRGSERLIIRGAIDHVDVTLEQAKQLAKEGYKFSGHTHPGGEIKVLTASGDDYEILKAFGQKQSVAYNSKGQHMTYELEGGEQ